MNNIFPKLIALVVIIAVGAIGFFSILQRVPQGHVGILVHTMGNSRGPDVEALPMGRYFVNPFTQELHLMETFTKNYAWTEDRTEGSRENEEIVFQDQQGLVIRTDVGIEMSVNGERAAFLFERYRRKVEEIIDGPLRNYVRDRFVAHASTMLIEDIHGARKTELLQLVRDDVQAEYEQYGINVSQLYWIGEMRIPPAVERSIEARVQATQDAIRAENQLRQTEAQAAMDVAQAVGEAEALVAAASGEAQAIELRGAALRANPEVLQQDAIQRWNGVLPSVLVGDEGSTPFIQIPSGR